MPSYTLQMFAKHNGLSGMSLLSKAKMKTQKRITSEPVGHE